MKYYLIAGEASGDQHASKIMEKLKQNDPKFEFRFFGGNLMKQQSGTLVKHYKEMSYMGLWEVVKNLGKIKENLKLCKEDIIKWKPDVVILIDYPGFNLKIAKFAKNNNFKVVYYISPKVWVWKTSRVKIIKKYIDKMYVIFPFEVDFYKKFNYDVSFLGNPTLETVYEHKQNKIDREEFKITNNLTDKPIIALLPGSRVQEISKILPVMCNIIDEFTDFQFVVAGVSFVEKELYTNIVQDKNIKVVFDDTFNLLRMSQVAVVASGTATLETAIFNVPQVVCYKTSKLSYRVGKAVVKTKYFSLVNILMQKQVVVELLQNNLEQDIIDELKKLTTDKVYNSEMLSNYKALSDLLGEPGVSGKISNDIVKLLS